MLQGYNPTTTTWAHETVWVHAAVVGRHARPHATDTRSGSSS